MEVNCTRDVDSRNCPEEDYHIWVCFCSNPRLWADAIMGWAEILTSSGEWQAQLAQFTWGRYVNHRRLHFLHITQQYLSSPILLCQSPFKRWDIFLHSLESGLAACLLWLIEFSRNETFWVLSSVLIWPRISHFLSHGMLPLGTPSLQTQTSCCKKRPCMGILLAGSTIPSTSPSQVREPSWTSVYLPRSEASICSYGLAAIPWRSPRENHQLSPVNSWKLWWEKTNSLSH